MLEVNGRLLKVHDNYGTETVRLEGRGESGPYPYDKRVLKYVYGTVVSGYQTSRLFQYSSTRDTTGEQRTLYGVSDADIERGEKRYANCG